MLETELPAALSEVHREEDIREVLKSGLGYDFEIIDPILLAHRRVLGLPHSQADLQRH